MYDIIGNADMTQGSLTSFTSDRFGNANSALALNGGYTQVPSGFYFNTAQYSISAWIYPQNISSFARLIDFGNCSNLEDEVIVSIDSGNNQKPHVKLYDTMGSTKAIANSSQILTNGN